jgi:pimeloyl-ACP methyl ester carboxylesterase
MPRLWTLDFRTSLGEIRTPTLVIGGASDPIVPVSHVRSLHEVIAGSECLIVDDAGHVPTTARRREVADRVRSFLRNRAR